jgi:probable phosphoglycerate mutase
VTDGRPAAPGELFLVRHGATEWSVTGRHTGRTDLPLLPEGEEKARAVGSLLARRHFALVLTSPLRRARRTAELAGHPEALVDDDLLEWDYGELEGLTTAEIRTSRPGWTVFSGPVPGGETLDEVATRVDRVIARARAVDGDTLVVAHGHVLRVLAARWCELDPVEGRRLPLATATLSVLGWEHAVPGIHLWNASGDPTTDATHPARRPQR